MRSIVDRQAGDFDLVEQMSYSFVQVGNQVYMEGHLQNDEWKDADGNRCYWVLPGRITNQKNTLVSNRFLRQMWGVDDQYGWIGPFMLPKPKKKKRQRQSCAGK
jgi:hypothetical protein